MITHLIQCWKTIETGYHDIHKAKGNCICIFTKIDKYMQASDIQFSSNGAYIR